VREPRVLTRLLAFALAVAAGLQSASGAEPDANRRQTVIEPQPLGRALIELSKIHGIQLIYLPDDVGGLQSPGVRGVLTLEEALRELLRDTGLGFRYVDESTVTIVPLARNAPQEGAPAPRGISTAGAGAAGRDGTARSRRAATPEPDSDTQTLAEVQVTGSRILREGFRAPTPVKSVAVDELRAFAPTSLPDALGLLHEFRNSQTPQSTGITTTGNAGQSFLNLRSLGIERTLILLDGRRVVPSSLYGTTDISVLPDEIIERVDIVTGGASAAYGSDAVAGVVNFVIDRDFTGVRVTGRYGGADEGDAVHRRVGITAGSFVFGGRGHLMVNGSSYDNSGVPRSADRDWFGSCARIENAALVPRQIVACGVRSSRFTRGGLVSAGPLSGTQFVPGGEPRAFEYGALHGAGAMVGGGGEDFGADYQLVPSVRRRNVFGRFTYDLTPRSTVLLEGLYGDAQAQYHSTASWQGQATAFTIYRDNAFLPQSIRDAMDSASIDSFPLARYDSDFGPLRVHGRNRTRRFVAGLDVELGTWQLSAYFADGRNRYLQTIANNANVNRLYNAVDAVVDPATGRIVCRSSLSDPGNGCIPLNLFGSGSPSREALDWVLGTSVQDVDVEQRVFEATLSGEPVGTRAGPLSLAVGVGWRREVGEQRTDAVSQTPRMYTGGYLGWPASIAFDGQMGAWERNNPQPLAGAYDVREAFLETAVPIARGKAGTDLVELNGAVRYTDYSTSGGVTTWKAGMVYSPFPGVRLRATRSRDIRAPNLTELYRGRVNGQSNLIDPFQPIGSPDRNPFVFGSSFGSPALVPETGDTRTVGLVVEPERIPGLSVAVDYYDIRLKGAITTLGGQKTVDQCYAGATMLCQYLVRDERGVLVAVYSPFLNIESRRTSGVDFELAWKTPMTGLVANVPGELTLRAYANHVRMLESATPGAETVDVAGQNGVGGVPDWSADLALHYQAGRISVHVLERFIAGGKLDNTASPMQLAPGQNRVSSIAYTDLAVGIDIPIGDSRLKAALTLSNAFDRDPPAAPNTFFVFGTTGTNTALYDVTGRTLSLGLQLAF